MVVVSVETEKAHEVAPDLQQHGRHIGPVLTGRQVDGTIDVWELHPNPDANSDAPTWTTLVVTLPDDSVILVNASTTEVGVLYEFLTRIEDAPGSLERKAS